MSRIKGQKKRVTVDLRGLPGLAEVGTDQNRRTAGMKGRMSGMEHGCRQGLNNFPPASFSKHVPSCAYIVAGGQA